MKKIPEAQIIAVDAGGNQQDMAVLEETGVMYDPTKAALDLSKDEKRRTTALLMAIQAYSHLIIKDADYLEAAYRRQDREPEAPRIRPATMDAMVMGALQFDDFISGKLQERLAMQAEEAEEGTK